MKKKLSRLFSGRNNQMLHKTHLASGFFYVPKVCNFVKNNNHEFCNHQPVF
jgi:hypothetical protein